MSELHDSKEEKKDSKSSAALVVRTLASSSESSPASEEKSQKAPERILLLDIDSCLVKGNKANQAMLAAAKKWKPTKVALFTQRNRYMDFTTLGQHPDSLSTEQVLTLAQNNFADLKDNEGKQIQVQVSSSMDPIIGDRVPFAHWANIAASNAAFIAKVNEFYTVRNQINQIESGDVSRQEEKKKLQARLPALQTAVFKDILAELLLIEPENAKFLELQAKQTLDDEDISVIQYFANRMYPRTKDAQFFNLIAQVASPNSTVVLMDDVAENYWEIANSQQEDEKSEVQLEFVHAVDQKKEFKLESEYDFELKLSAALVGSDVSVQTAAEQFLLSIRERIAAFAESKEGGGITEAQRKALDSMWDAVLSGNYKQVESAIAQTSSNKKLLQMLSGECKFSGESKAVNTRRSIDELFALVKNSRNVQSLLESAEKTLHSLDRYSEAGQMQRENLAIALATALKKSEGNHLSPTQLKVLRQFVELKPTALQVDGSADAFTAIEYRIAKDTKFQTVQKHAAAELKKKMEEKELGFEDSQVGRQIGQRTATPRSRSPH